LLRGIETLKSFRLFTLEFTTTMGRSEAVFGGIFCIDKKDWAQN